MKVFVFALAILAASSGHAEYKFYNVETMSIERAEMLYEKTIRESKELDLYVEEMRKKTRALKEIQRKRAEEAMAAK